MRLVPFACDLPVSLIMNISTNVEIYGFSEIIPSFFGVLPALFRPNIEDSRLYLVAPFVLSRHQPSQKLWRGAQSKEEED